MVDAMRAMLDSLMGKAPGAAEPPPPSKQCKGEALPLSVSLWVSGSAALRQGPQFNPRGTPEDDAGGVPPQTTGGPRPLQTVPLRVLPGVDSLSAVGVRTRGLI